MVGLHGLGEKGLLTPAGGSRELIIRDEARRTLRGRTVHLLISSRDVFFRDVIGQAQHYCGPGGRTRRRLACDRRRRRRRTGLAAILGSSTLGVKACQERLGRVAAGPWQRADARLPELFIGGEVSAAVSSMCSARCCTRPRTAWLPVREINEARRKPRQKNTNGAATCCDRGRQRLVAD